ncbi:hypothetical protein [Nostoc sp. T09]|uniref:hypothetical protein n=1 Tax=Nostoc sp. T09 TaxID=1932621 RepID=UPI0015C50DF3|nr:hypothetical protein [Nostoc sp. T09]
MLLEQLYYQKINKNPQTYPNFRGGDESFIPESLNSAIQEHFGLHPTEDWRSLN